MVAEVVDRWGPEKFECPRKPQEADDTDLGQRGVLLPKGDRKNIGKEAEWKPLGDI
jgi:hypothetical protein